MPKIVSLLLERGAQVNTDERTPALSAAVKAQRTEVVHILLLHGANVHVRDATTGWTPLQAAKVNGYAEIKRLLVEAGATE